MLIVSCGARPTIGKRIGERPVQKLASPLHSQWRPSRVVSVCISAPSAATSSVTSLLLIRVSCMGPPTSQDFFLAPDQDPKPARRAFRTARCLSHIHHPGKQRVKEPRKSPCPACRRCPS